MSILGNLEETGLLNREVIKRLDALDIINLCQSNTQLKNACNNPALWRYLLRRDYNIHYDGNDSYQEYGRRVIVDISNMTATYARRLLQKFYDDVDNTTSLEDSALEYALSGALRGVPSYGGDRIKIMGIEMDSKVEVIITDHTRGDFELQGIIINGPVTMRDLLYYKRITDTLYEN